MGDGNRDGRLHLVRFEANQSHVAKDVLDLLLQVCGCFFTFADAVTRDLMDLLNDRLITVPEHLPLMKLLLSLCLLLDDVFSFLFKLFYKRLCPLLKAL